jgi:hypothetical protein
LRAASLQLAEVGVQPGVPPVDPLANVGDEVRTVGAQPVQPAHRLAELVERVEGIEQPPVERAQEPSEVRHPSTDRTISLDGARHGRHPPRLPVAGLARKETPPNTPSTCRDHTPPARAGTNLPRLTVCSIERMLKAFAQGG